MDTVVSIILKKIPNAIYSRTVNAKGRDKYGIWHESIRPGAGAKLRFFPQKIMIPRLPERQYVFEKSNTLCYVVIKQGGSFAEEYSLTKEDLADGDIKESTIK